MPPTLRRLTLPAARGIRPGMSDFDPTPAHRNFYGRRHGKTLRQSQKGYLSQDLGTLRPRGITVQDNPGRIPIDPAAIVEP